MKSKVKIKSVINSLFFLMLRLVKKGLTLARGSLVPRGLAKRGATRSGKAWHFVIANSSLILMLHNGSGDSHR